MTRYVALLRGINLGGRARIGMGDLRQLFTDLGHADVTTYLQSGNVVFTSTDGEPSRLARDIEQRISSDLDVATTILLRTADDLARVVAASPYASREPDLTKLHVTFLLDTPADARTARITAPSGESAEFWLAGREAYLHCPDGYGRTKLNNAFFERHLGVAATTRNWRTVTKLHDLTST